MCVWSSVRARTAYLCLRIMCLSERVLCLYRRALVVRLRRTVPAGHGRDIGLSAKLVVGRSAAIIITSSPQATPPVWLQIVYAYRARALAKSEQYIIITARSPQRVVHILQVSLTCAHTQTDTYTHINNTNTHIPRQSTSTPSVKTF